MGGLAVELARRIKERKRLQQLQAEMSGNNFSSSGTGVYGHSENTAPYISSSARLPPGNRFSPKAQKLAKNPASNTVNIVGGQKVSEYLPVTTGGGSSVTYQNGIPNVTISLPSKSYTDIANDFIQATIKGERPQLPPNITTFSYVVPPRDSSADRAATNIASPLSNATPNVTTTYIEPTKIQVNQAP